jgi:hypothetical protein
MGPDYVDFSRKLSKFFSNVTDSALIRRRTPKHEVIYPHVIKETRGEEVLFHLLILGAEVKAKQLGMGYGSKSGSSTHSYTCFFLYGTEKEDSRMGAIVEKRFARGMEFHMYDFVQPAVRKRAKQFFDLIIK